MLDTFWDGTLCTLDRGAVVVACCGFPVGVQGVVSKHAVVSRSIRQVSLYDCHRGQGLCWHVSSTADAPPISYGAGGLRGKKNEAA